MRCEFEPRPKKTCNAAFVHIDNSVGTVCSEPSLGTHWIATDLRSFLRDSKYTCVCTRIRLNYYLLVAFGIGSG